MRYYLHVALFFMLLGGGVAKKNVTAQPQCPPATGVSASPTMTCIGKPITLNATLPAGTTTLNWYTTQTGGTPIATTTLPSVNYTPTATGNFTYYVEAVGGNGSPTVQNFTYTGAVQQATLQPGSYEIEAWGANGGGTQGGKGGYSKGTLTLASPTVVYIVVGGAGGSGGSPQDLNGGYNGGGPRPNPGGATRGSGGGATHVATVTGELKTLSGNQSAVKIVAGGAGGGSNAGAGVGNGGGLTGQNSNGANPGLGGTQTSGGAAGAGTGGSPGSFGQGGQSLDMAGAGGGGWYGGGAGGGSVAGNTSNGGGGGSSYIGGVTAGVTIMFGQTGYVTNPNANGDGYVRITGAGVTCTASQRVGTNTVSIGTPPVVDLGPDIVECDVQLPVVNLDAGNPGASYNWDDNSNAQTRTVTQTGTYYVEVTNSFGCSVRDTIEVSLGISPIVNLGPSDTFFCADSIILDAGNAGAQYEWHDNSMNQKFIVDTTGKYFVTVTNQDGCTESDTITIELKKLPSGFFDMNNWGGYNNPTYTFVGHLQNVTNFFWDFGDGSPTSTMNPVNHTYMTMGTYTAKLHIFNECGSKIIEARPQNIKVGVNEIVNNFFNVYPNPASHTLNIDGKDGQIIELVTIIDALGRTVITENVNQQHVKMDVSKLVTGIYSVSVKTNKGIAVQKISIVGN